MARYDSLLLATVLLAMTRYNLPWLVMTRLVEQLAWICTSQEQKEQHELEVAQFQRNFDELLGGSPIPPPLSQTSAVPSSGPPVRKETRVAAR